MGIITQCPTLGYYIMPSVNIKIKAYSKKIFKNFSSFLPVSPVFFCFQRRSPFEKCEFPGFSAFLSNIGQNFPVPRSPPTVSAPFFPLPPFPAFCQPVVSPSELPRISCIALRQKTFPARRIPSGRNRAVQLIPLSFPVYSLSLSLFRSWFFPLRQPLPPLLSPSLSPQKSRRKSACSLFAVYSCLPTVPTVYNLYHTDQLPSALTPVPLRMPCQGGSPKPLKPVPAVRTS